jgi:hypothetical protein
VPRQPRRGHEHEHRGEGILLLGARDAGEELLLEDDGIGMDENLHRRIACSGLSLTPAAAGSEGNPSAEARSDPLARKMAHHGVEDTAMTPTAHAKLPRSTLVLIWLVIAVELVSPIPLLLTLGAVWVMLVRPPAFLDLVLRLYGQEPRGET